MGSQNTRAVRTGHAGLEPVAVADADAIHALVVAGRSGIGGVFEVDGQALPGVEPDTEFQGDVKQDPGAQGLAVYFAGSQVAVVQRGPQAQAQEEAARQVDLPAQIRVGLAGIPLRIDRAADRGAQAAAEDGKAGTEQNLAVDVEAALEPKPAPQ